MAIAVSAALPASLSRFAPRAAGPQPQSAYEETKDALSGALYVHRALPSFLYPAVTGTAAEKALILQTLDALPLQDVSSASTIRMVPEISYPGIRGLILGATQPATMDVQISRFGTSLRQIEGYAGPVPKWEPSGSMNPNMVRGTLVHELGHARDMRGGFPRVIIGGASSDNGPWGSPPHVTDYATTSSKEDFAESHALYHLGKEGLKDTPKGDQIQSLSDAKREAMERLEQESFMERLVDSRPFRETGRKFGELTSAAPVLRTGLTVVASLATFSMLLNGASKVINGVSESQGHQTVEGLLCVGAGLGLALAGAHPLLGPAALALIGAERGMERADRDAPTPGKNRATHGVAAAAAVGGAIGGVVGGTVGPLGGTLAGYAVGGPIGGVVGLLAGSILGFQLGSALGARAGIAVAR